MYTYKIFGTVGVKACQEVQKLADDYSNYTMPLSAYYQALGNGSALVIFKGTCQSYEDIRHDLIEMVQALAPFVTHPQLLECEIDEQRGNIYIGPPDKKEETISNKTLIDMQENIHKLTRNAKKQLVEQLQAGIQND